MLNFGGVSRLPAGRQFNSEFVWCVGMIHAENRNSRFAIWDDYKFDDGNIYSSDLAVEFALILSWFYPGNHDVRGRSWLFSQPTYRTNNINRCFERLVFTFTLAYVVLSVAVSAVTKTLVRELKKLNNRWNEEQRQVNWTRISFWNGWCLHAECTQSPVKCMFQWWVSLQILCLSDEED